MATYLILNIFVLFTVLLVIGKPFPKPSRVWYGVLGVLLVLTAIFDNVIVGLDIVGYSTHKILGVYICVAPIEDFMYAVLAAIVIPVVWNRLGQKHAK